MGSYNEGKAEIVKWLKERYTGTCLDVGACDGKWRKLLGDHFTMDAVEAYGPNAVSLNGYRRVYVQDICTFEYEWYDVILFCDVIEHLPIDKAQKVLEYAKPRCKDMLVAVPYELEQEAIYGNPYEVHIQDDLTEMAFNERYPGFEMILRPRKDYAYYHILGR